MHTVIAVDAMGGDYGPPVTIPAVARCLRLFDDVTFVLVGDEQQIRAHLDKIPKKYLSRIRLQPAVVDSGDERMESFSSVRNKADSPIGVGIDALSHGEADAFVSAGHTAYLLASSTFRLKRIPGLSRPAICSAIPNGNHFSLLLDVGANLESNAENLYEFALMGSLLANVVLATKQPRVALLNIGSEAVKGTEVIKNAAELIEHSPFLNYVGFVEGHDLFKGHADVIVCDGFSGNVALKASEGAAVYIHDAIVKRISSTWLQRISASLAFPIFANLKKQLSPQTFNGAILLGVQGIVVKSHGHADVYGFSQAISRAVLVSQGQLLDSIREKFQLSVV